MGVYVLRSILAFSFILLLVSSGTAHAEGNTPAVPQAWTSDGRFGIGLGGGWARREVPGISYGATSSGAVSPGLGSTSSPGGLIDFDDEEVDIWFGTAMVGVRLAEGTKWARAPRLKLTGFYGAGDDEWSATTPAAGTGTPGGPALISVTGGAASSFLADEFRSNLEIDVLHWGTELRFEADAEPTETTRVTPSAFVGYERLEHRYRLDSTAQNLGTGQLFTSFANEDVDNDAYLAGVGLHLRQNVIGGLSVHLGGDAAYVWSSSTLYARDCAPGAAGSTCDAAGFGTSTRQGQRSDGWRLRTGAGLDFALENATFFGGGWVGLTELPVAINNPTATGQKVSLDNQALRDWGFQGGVRIAF